MASGCKLQASSLSDLDKKPVAELNFFLQQISFLRNWIKSAINEVLMPKPCSLKLVA
jgi:hypothetical protein